MTRTLSRAVFVAGLLAVAWVGAGYVGSSPLALAVTLLIATFYLAGGLELHRFDQATAGLAQALEAVPDPLPRLADWLPQVPAALQNPVRLRIEGERVGLPGPALTPYLVGLLVLLGMLGTFLGMVVTLNGTVIALESTTDLQAIRASLAAPVKGLGLAFGTSVAGVCASALLGLVSALCRRERLQVSQRLDSRIATTLRGFSLSHQREQTLHTLQQQALAAPALMHQLQALMGQMDRQHQALGERLLAGQEGFHRHAEAVYTGLATSIDRSLKHSLAESARLAGATIAPAVEATMAGIARETSVLQAHLASVVQQQLDGLSARFATTMDTVSDAWRDALAQQEHRVASQAAALQATLATHDEQRFTAWTESLAAMVALLQREWQHTGIQTLGQQQQICQVLEQTARDIAVQADTHARTTLAEIAGLMQAASQAPRVAAEVIGQLRQQLSDSLLRDNAQLEERGRMMAALGSLLEAVQHTTGQQQAAVDALVSSAATTLERAGTRFTEQVASTTTELSAVAGQITGSAVEVASLGEAFGHAVQRFSESSSELTAHLQRIEAALGRSMARSDEQLAYYVAQAREIIDLSLGAQKQIVDELQQLATRQTLAAGEPA
ncbi:MAG: DUF802 domain-containing protein [Burkholderiales bacterium]|nr:DUF802 domain-containing protein [Burkholderiales bacterium]